MTDEVIFQLDNAGKEYSTVFSSQRWKESTVVIEEKPAETQACIRLASHLVREPYTPNLNDESLNPLRGREPCTLIT